jgi:hypothetical protein
MVIRLHAANIGWLRVTHENLIGRVGLMPELCDCMSQDISTTARCKTDSEA